MDPQSRVIRTQATRSAHKEHSVPVFATSSFVFDTAEEARSIFADEQPGHIYTRFSNPNSDEFISRLCAFEGTEDGIATASGMAAVNLAMMALLRPGDHILAGRQLFGTTHSLINQVLPKWGISHSWVNLTAREEWEEGILPMTRMIYCETPSNPTLELADLAYLGRLAKKHNLYLVVDNCFASPYLQQPFKWGADLVIHSATKFIDGQGRTIGGAVLGQASILEEIRMLARISGPILSPFNAWILSKSLETLAARMEMHCRTALALARHLESLSQLNWVRYPFLPSHPQFKLARKQMKMGGGLISLELKGGLKAAMQMINQLKLASISSNLGDSRTIVSHPATTTHARLTEEEQSEAGITPGIVRISVGLEHPSDLIADFDQAIHNL